MVFDTPHPTPAFPFNVMAFPINVMAFPVIGRSHGLPAGHGQVALGANKVARGPHWAPQDQRHSIGPQAPLGHGLAPPPPPPGHGNGQ